MCVIVCGLTDSLEVMKVCVSLGQCFRKEHRILSSQEQKEKKEKHRAHPT